VDNKFCADCGSPKPRYVLVNFGIVICDECASVHRLFEPNIATEKSVTDKNWTTEEIKFIKSRGNKKVNEIYESCKVKQPLSRRHTLENNSETRIKYIKGKWIDSDLTNRLAKLNESNGSQAKSKVEPLSIIKAGLHAIELILPSNSKSSLTKPYTASMVDVYCTKDSFNFDFSTNSWAPEISISNKTMQRKSDDISPRQ